MASLYNYGAVAQLVEHVHGMHRVRVQIPSAPQILVKFLYIKEIYLQTKELISSQFLIAIITVLQVSYV